MSGKKICGLLTPGKCYIIAEIGGNFLTVTDGKRLIDAAAEAGADAVKLQTYRGATITTAHAMFDMENTGRIRQIDFFKKYELSEEAHRELFAHAASMKLDCFSTPSHPNDVDLLERCDVPCHKIGADDAVNTPFLEYVAKIGKPILLSTGMCTMEEIRRAVDTIVSTGNENVVLFHTVSGYPTKAEDVNLNAMLSIKREFPHFAVGFSDHSLGIWASLAAATMGAELIERHFTLDKNADGPDHMLSLEPAELAELVRQIRLVERMRGSSIKRPYGPEVQNRRNNRKSMVVMRDIPKGGRISVQNVWPKRSGTGIPPSRFADILGRVAARDIDADTVLSWDDID